MQWLRIITIDVVSQSQANRKRSKLMRMYLGMEL